MRAVIIGLGGIGTYLAEPVCRLLVYSKQYKIIGQKRVILVDGDAYEDRNRERQKFSLMTNKAEATKELIAASFPELEIEAKPYYADSQNIFLFVREGDVIFSAVDNHAVRKIISEHAETLSDVLLVSGGNDEVDGNVQIYERSGGKDLTPPITFLHPEIEFPKDRNPGEMGCEELALLGAAPQLLCVNMMIASMMLNVFNLWLFGWESPPYREIYFDLKSGVCRPIKADHGMK